MMHFGWACIDFFQCLILEYLMSLIIAKCSILLYLGALVAPPVYDHQSFNMCIIYYLAVPKLICIITDGDSKLGHCEPLHSSTGPTAQHVCRLLADGVGTTVPSGGHVDHTGRAGSGQVSPVLAWPLWDYGLWQHAGHLRQGGADHLLRLQRVHSRQHGCRFFSSLYQASMRS